MNNLQYRIMSYLHKKSGKEEINLDELNDSVFNYFEECKMKYSNLELDISKEEFFVVLTGIYNVLKMKISNEQFIDVLFYYLKLVIADGVLANNKITAKWFVNKVYYLALYRFDSGKKGADITCKFKDDILYIQDILYKEFSFDESLKGKVSRKVYTNFMSSLG